MSSNKRPLPPVALRELMRDIMAVPDALTGGPLTLPKGAEPLDEYLCHEDCPSFLPFSAQCKLTGEAAPCLTEAVSLVCTSWLRVRDERVRELRENVDEGVLRIVEEMRYRATGIEEGLESESVTTFYYATIADLRRWASELSASLVTYNENECSACALACPNCSYYLITTAAFPASEWTGDCPGCGKPYLATRDKVYRYAITLVEENED